MSDFNFPAFDEYNLDREEQALCEYFLRLQCIFDKAQEEFHYVFSTWAKLERLRDAIQAEYDEMCRAAGDSISVRPADEAGGIGKIELPLVYSPGIGAAELREQSALLRAECSAGSLILMVDDCVQRLRQAVWSDEEKTPYPAQFTLGKLTGALGYASTAMYAAGNAYRHAKDREGLVRDDGRVDETHRNFAESKRTLEILQKLTGLDAIASRSVCVASLTVLAMDRKGKPSLAALWDGRLTEIGRDFAIQYCKSNEAYKRVESALSYQAHYNAVETSYTMNPLLFEDEDGDEFESTL